MKMQTNVLPLNGLLESAYFPSTLVQAQWNQIVFDYTELAALMVKSVIMQPWFSWMRADMSPLQLHILIFIMPSASQHIDHVSG